MGYRWSWHLIADLVQWVRAQTIGFSAWNNRVLRSYRQTRSVPSPALAYWRTRVRWRFAIAPFDV